MALLSETELVDRATRLVAEGRIPPAEFIRAYDERRSLQRQSPQFATLAAASDSEVAAFRAAVVQARADGFFVGLWSTLLDRGARGSLFGNNDVEAITGHLADEGTAGTMQKVMRSAGFRSVSTYPLLMKAARATGLVSVQGGGEGTGFLVGPDLLLTAAHVVSSLLTQNGDPKPDSGSSIMVQFYNQLEAPGTWPITVRVAKDWLVKISPPHGAPPNLKLEDQVLAPTSLDFALVRLAEPVGLEIGYIDIRQPATPLKDARLTIIGYPGGSDCLSDDDQVRGHDATAGRVRHGANSLAGMSGSPCLDHTGSVLAIHEGAVTVVNPNYNRAVHLAPVRQSLIQNGTDLLESQSEPLWGITDAAARRAWVSVGQTMLGKSDATRAEWLSLIEAFNLDSTTGAQSGDAFHPVFGRAGFQRWVDKALSPHAESRIATISGASGVGKSFSVRLLRARTRTSGQLLVDVSPSVARTPLLASVLDLIYAEVAGARGEVAGARREVPTRPDGARPPAGVLRRDVLPDALADIEALVTADHTETFSRVLWLALDFGDESNLAPDMVAPWKQFLREAEKQPWLRVVMIGLTRGRYEEFLSALANRAVVFREALNQVSSDEFEACLLRILGSVAPAESPGDWQAKIADYFDQVDNLSAADGRTVEAVRMALEFRSKVLSAGRP